LRLKKSFASQGYRLLIFVRGFGCSVFCNLTAEFPKHLNLPFTYSGYRIHPTKHSEIL
jgi:hypothetical protein